ncbi:alpha/beta hydrolase [Achromobacter sp. B7]|uniref:alpha/beta hydrolase n=1 Tax=Achromobacter sp. B7 TaxID=2282475 RepID=UPI000E747AE9|nr:alpha/beta hydrolase [Achromobacter sp. B7]AYD66542.1 alpha/beta hydrolase [Achromobacter sp. B7]
MPTLYRDFKTQDEIDAQYDVEKSVPDFMIYAKHYVAESEHVRQRLPAHLDVPYGPTLDETVDIFPAAQAGAPVFVFIHGGAWRILSSKEFSTVASGLSAQGFTTVVVNYSLCPKVSIDEITRQSRAAVAWVIRNIGRFGGDPKRVVLGGHSAGGHLTAMCLQTDWEHEYGLPRDPLAGAVMVSGVFEIEPFRWSSIQPMLQIDDGVIRRNSPQHRVRACATPVLISWGSDEPSEFARQSQDFARVWTQAGNQAQTLMQDGRNHFDAIYGFEDPNHPLTEWIANVVTR